MFRRMFAAPLLCLVLTSAIPAQEKQPVLLKVTLPREDATLTIDDKPDPIKIGKVREYKSEPVEVGGTFTYTLRATILPNNYTTIIRMRKIKVTGGGKYDVDMTQNDPKSPDDITIRFVPTPPEIVEAMLKLAKVGKD